MAFLNETKINNLSFDLNTERDLNEPPMTINGTVVRSFMLLFLSVVAASFGWVFLGPRPELLLPALLLGAGGAIVFAIMAGRKPLQAKTPAMLYAVLQGVLVGAISAMFAANYGDIILQALMLTGTIVGVSLVLFSTGIVKVTQKFRSIVIMATFGIMGYYLVALLLLVAGIQVPLIWDTGLFGIGFSLFVLGIASLNLFLDYDVVQKGVNASLPESYEWYAAFGLVATVLWIYIEALRLFSKLQAGD
jgi:uncharacterized YccA/Bax inhibitor family protein